MRALLPSIVLCGLLLAASARAREPELWAAAEMQVPLHEGRSWVPDHVRLVSTLRAGGPLEGLTYLLLRVGPMWKISDHVGLNLNATAGLSERRRDEYVSDTRLEVEPNFVWHPGPFALNVRYRLERRWVGQIEEWRSRMRFGLGLEGTNNTWQPFVADELFSALDRTGLNESRAQAGVAFVVHHLQIVMSAMWRAQLSSGGGWNNTYVTYLSVLFEPALTKVRPLGTE